eukprot:MONOS_500.1-p1 / transcript=MONOS_500.1 / gene=MONOS_500 / organism=Monocercomonoides_exilis_PA203 / gene_product=unspecified product / transcript_product=unspecified product / location=Mono_scaffold00008:46598-47865(-) / protein_length=382 / sequence_SO=supercontig / SO=protein_coding / is_pseudo=false
MKNPFQVRDALVFLNEEVSLTENFIEFMKGINIIASLCLLLVDEDETVICLCLRILAQLVYLSDSFSDLLISSGSIPIVVKLASHSNPSIAKEALWLIANIVGCSDQIHTSVVLTSHGLEPVLSVLKELDSQTALKMEAMRVLTNVVASSQWENLSFLANAGCMRVLCECLKKQDEEITRDAVVIIWKLLVFGEKEMRLIEEGLLPVPSCDRTMEEDVSSSTQPSSAACATDTVMSSSSSSSANSSFSSSFCSSSGKSIRVLSSCSSACSPSSPSIQSLAEFQRKYRMYRNNRLLAELDSTNADVTIHQLTKSKDKILRSVAQELERRFLRVLFNDEDECEDEEEVEEEDEDEEDDDDDEQWECNLEDITETHDGSSEVVME